MMSIRFGLIAAGFSGFIAFSTAAFADPVVFFDDVAGGRTSFDNQISAAGGTQTNDALSGLGTANTWVRTGYTITSTNGANRNIHPTYLAGGAGGGSGGGGVTYSGGGDGINMTATGATDSGLTFTFSTAINGFGIDLADWGTCCYPSSMMISFDGGAPITVGTAVNGTSNPGVAAGDGYINFIGAIDDSGTFSVITLYGLGSGDALYAGGIIRYAVVPLGSISGGGYVETASPTPQQDLADYLDGHDGSGDLADVATYLDSQDAEGVSEALKEIFPVNTSTASQTMMGAMGQTTSVLIDKVGTVLGNMGTPPVSGFADNARGGLAQWLFGNKDYAEGGSLAFNMNEAYSNGVATGDMITSLAASPYQKFRLKDRAFWIEGVGAMSRGHDTDTAFGYDTNSHGVVAGLEYALDENNLVGALGSAFRTNVEIDSDAGRTKATSWTAGIYGQHLMGATKLSAVALFGYGKYDSRRNVDVGGITGTPEADYNAWSGSATLAISRLYDHNDWQFEPFALVNYSAVTTDDYTETGGGVFNMSVSGDRFSTAGIKAGITFLHKTKINETPLDLRVKPYAGYQWEIEDAGNVTRLAGTSPAGGATITGRDATTAEGGLALEAKLEFSSQSTAKLGVDLSKDKNEGRGVAYVGYGLKF